MSTQYMSPIWRLALPTSAKIILLKFGDNANDDGYAWPSIERVARECGLGESTVRDKVAIFRRDGVLVLKAGGKGGRAASDYRDDAPGATNRYWIDIERAKDLYRERGTGFGGGAQNAAQGAANPPDAGGLEPVSNPPDETPNPPDETPNPPDAGTASIEEPSSEPSSEPARARATPGHEGPVAPPGAEPQAEIGPSPEPPAYAAWRTAVPRILDRVGPEAYRTWLVQLTPLEDDGELLTLGAGGAFWCEHVKTEFGELLEGLVGRRIALRPWASFDVVADKRLRAGGWDGELGRPIERPRREPAPMQRERV